MTNRLRERLLAVERALAPPPKPAAGLPEVIRASGLGPPMTEAEADALDWRPIVHLVRRSIFRSPPASTTTAGGVHDDPDPDPPAA